MCVVPADVQRQLLLETRATIRDQQPSRALVLQGTDHTFDDCDTAVLADGSESLVDTSSSAPAPESLVAELLALVGDQVLGSGSSVPDGLPGIRVRNPVASGYSIVLRG